MDSHFVKTPHEFFVAYFFNKNTSNGAYTIRNIIHEGDLCDNPRKQSLDGHKYSPENPKYCDRKELTILTQKTIFSRKRIFYKILRKFEIEVRFSQISRYIHRARH